MTDRDAIEFARCFAVAAGLGEVPAEVERALAAALAHLVAAEPGLAGRQAALAEALGRAVAPRGGDEAEPAPDVSARLAGLVLDDLALAQAALAGEPAALARFDADLTDVAGGALGKMGASVDARQEIAQRLRERLLVGEAGGAPRLADYAGRGALRAWLRAAAIRTYLNSVRGAAREVGDDALLERLADPGADPELGLLRDRFRGEFQRAFGGALAALPDRDRTLLRMAYLDDLRLEELADLHQTSRATAHRWLTRARTELAAAVEDRLRTTLGLSEREFHSVRRLVQSQLEVSLRRILG